MEELLSTINSIVDISHTVKETTQEVDNGETDEVIESLKAVLVIFVPLPEIPHESFSSWQLDPEWLIVQKRLSKRLFRGCLKLSRSPSAEQKQYTIVLNLSVL